MSEKKKETINNAEDPKEPPSSQPKTQYPLRPDELDCFRYLKHGFCVYGPECQFNHPVDRMKALRESGMLEVDAEYAVKCKYYALPGGCKYGDDCKFAHYLEKSDIEQLENYHELSDIGELGPISFASFSAQMQEKECPFYIHHGFCKFLPICKFRHPSHVALSSEGFLPGYENDESPKHYEPGTSSKLAKSSGYPLKISDEPASFSDMSQPYMPTMYFHSQSSTSYDGYQDLATSPSSERNAYCHPHSTLSSCTTMSYHHVCKQAKIEESSKPPIETKFPSSFFAATSTSTIILTGLPTARSSFGPEVKFQQQYASPCLGGCTSRANDCQQANNECRPQQLTQCYRPSTCITSTSAGNLSPTGLPLRPDRPICEYYSQFGICKYGPACEFDHPVDHISRASAAA
ncbi:putative zinc finger CCCH domain-containing protein 63 isoform X2 [Iris pallida]|uniref:Zinc finger CCCH domain-containing protein 63 isoform X2 n=1 Tax=Iris pallida TaxID=29817 RepID=A0AAX6F498_IRIPA|nr:putative zinc finger CCCH domain-containing protein 63 isoform X2 [Iris pallida]